MDGNVWSKMWLRNVRHPSRTRKFWYYILVFFMVVDWGMHVLLWTDTQESKMAPKTANSKTFR